MAKRKVTLAKAAFYKLYISWKEDPMRFVKAWEFVGEIYIKPLGKWTLMSYSCPRRLIEIMQENPGLIERRYTTGRSGARYYEYRFSPDASIEKIKDPIMLEFYKKIKFSLKNEKES